jgi:hypothetical protein
VVIEQLHRAVDLFESLAAQGPPNPPPAPLPGRLGEFSNSVIGWLKTLAIIFGVGMLVVSGIMVIVGRRNRNQFAQDGLVGTAWVVAGLAIVGSAATIVGAIPT